jgi:transcriptional regulator with XRE-family HTH domain
MGTESAFGQVLVEYRRARGMSRSQLAEQAELSYPYVSQLETGLRKPSRDAARRLAEALGIDPLDLEATIPANWGDVEMTRASRETRKLLTGVAPASQIDSAAFEALSVSRSAPPTSRRPSSRDDLIGQIIDLLEELDAGERLDALADVQRLAMQRILEQRGG